MTPEAAPHELSLPIPLAAPPVVLLRLTSRPRDVDAWALALTVKGISPLIRWSEGVFELHVHTDDVAAATAELVAVDEEEHAAEQARSAQATLVQRPVSKRPAVGAIALALLLLGFYAVTGPRVTASTWFDVGASDAERVLHGEWWRAVTALTLHADSAHVLSNVALGTLAVGAVMRSEGIGWGTALVLASGTAGNLLNAWVHQSLHSSVGFSTALFGAIGILGGIRYMQTRRLQPVKPAWVALAGTLALLALLGSSDKPQVDVLAHLFGVLSGVVIGIGTERFDLRPRTRVAQGIAGVGAAAAVLGAWWTALH